MTFAKRAAAITVGAVVLITAAILASTAPNPRTTVAECQASPQAQINALPSGGTFMGSGCYTVPYGLVITKPVTINGGTYVDPSTTLPGPGSGVHGTLPVFKVLDTHDVTLENVTAQGANPLGHYVGTLVGMAGVIVLSSSNVTLANITTSATFGDGVELIGNYELHHPKPVHPDTSITVDTLSVTKAGRDCFNPIEVFDSTFTNVTCHSSAKPSVDMESDEHGLGSGSLTFVNLVAPSGVNIIEPTTGLLDFQNATLGMRFHDESHGDARLTGTILCQRAALPACVGVGGGTLTLGVTFTFRNGTNPIIELPYRATPPGVIVKEN